MRTYLKSLLFLLSCLFVFSPPFSLSLASADNEPRYTIKAAVDPAAKTITAGQTITFTNTTSKDLDHLVFHLYANRKYTGEEKKFILMYAAYFKVNPYPDGFQEGDMTFKDITENGQPLNFKVEGKDRTILKVMLKQALKPGGTVTLAMDYTIKVPHAYGRFGWHKNIMTLSRWYPILAVLDDAGWKEYPFYPFHRPFFSAASFYFVELTVPQDEVVIHSGELIKVTTGNGHKILSIGSSLPIREFSLAMSPDYKVIETAASDVRIRSFYLPGDEKSARAAFQSARDMMAFYSRKFGPYPYKVYSIAPVYLGYGGEQMSNLCYIDTRVFKLPQLLNRYFDFLIAHETGHQWFYNLVGMDEYTEMWLEEGVHSYFVGEYLKDKYGPGAEVIDFPSWAKRWTWLLPDFTFDQSRDVRYKIIARIGLDHPVAGELSSFQEPSSIFALTYGKGARIVEMLRNQIGEEALNKIFDRIFKEYRFKNLTIADLTRISEEVSGQNLKGFFKDWLYTDGHLDVAVKKVRKDRLTLINKGDIRMPTEVEVNYAGGEKYSFLWDGQQKEETLKLKDGKAVRSVFLDPNNKLLDLDRTNNAFPRDIKIKPVPIYLPLYDIPALMPDDSYNLVVGPEIAHGGPGIKVSLQKPYEQNFYGATDYEFSEETLHSRVGYQLNNLWQSPTALGFEIANHTDYKDGDDDLVAGKVFLRHELSPVPYGLFDMNDHVSLYMIRNAGLINTLISGGEEDARNISYKKRNEAIVGTAMHWDLSYPYPDPNHGFRIDTAIENSGHFLGATQQFTRINFDVAFYQAVTKRSKLAFRARHGWGSAEDKNLFELGGIDGLRGFDRKDIRGANVYLGSVEYRFPILDDLKIHLMDNAFGLETISGVVFFDAGQAWYDDTSETSVHKDAGVGLRMTVNLGSFLEKVIVRADIAQALNEQRNDPHMWLGVNHAF